jgi:tight adherence protein C
MLLLIAVSTFVCGAFTVMVLYSLAFRTRSVASERLAKLESQTINAPVKGASQEHSPVAAIAELVSEPLNRLVPPSAAEAAKLRKQLMQAGFRSHDAPLIYRAIQLSSMVMLPLAVAASYLVLGKPISTAMLPVLLAFIAGFFIPRFTLSQMIKRRKLRIQWGLPDALDLMVVCVEAGLGLNASIVRVSEEIRDVHADMSKEFGLVNLEIRVGRSREEALTNLAERTGVEDLSSLVSMLIQADRFGTSITRAIRVYSDALRTKRRQRAEQAAQMAAVKLLLPLAAFLFPTLFIAILGPAALNLVDALRNM